MAIFEGYKSHIHLIARGLVIREEEVIVCRPKDTDWYFLPGGHIEDGESARSALLRELNEEMGITNWVINSFIGVCENIFPLESGAFQHEINIIFEVDVPSGFEINAKEDHIEFLTIPIKDFKSYKILPDNLKGSLSEWLENKQAFFKEL